MIFLYYRKGSGQNHPKSLFLNAFINIELSFLQIGSKYSLQLIKWGIFHSTGSNRAVILTGAKGSNRITLMQRVLNQTLMIHAQLKLDTWIAEFSVFSLLSP